MKRTHQRRGFDEDRETFSLPVKTTRREHVDPNAPRTVVTIGNVGPREKGYIFGKTDGSATEDVREVFLHGSSFDSDLFHALQPGDRVTVVLTHGEKGYKGLAGRRWTGNEA